MIQHQHSYIICATPRSGSTLLCDLLTGTGITGRPNSFFRQENYIEWAEYFNVSVAEWCEVDEFDKEYLSAVLNEGRNGTPVFGLRLMWESIDRLSKNLDRFYPNLSSDSARFESAFGAPLYIHLSRKDKVAQAVSRLKAEQSGLWHKYADGTERERLNSGTTPSYDAIELSKLVSQAEEDDLSWANWFVQEGIQPLCLTYEDLAKQPKDLLGMILTSLGLDSKIAEKANVKTLKLANDESLEWVARFRSETQRIIR